MLKAMGIEDEKIDQIIDAHTETIDALKDERDGYKDDAAKLATVQKELDDLKKDGGDWQKKYEKEHADFEAYKTDITKKETKTAKESAYRALLKESGVSEKRIDAIVKITDVDAIELDNEGKIKDSAAKMEHIKTEYADFIGSTTTRGAQTSTPPANNGGAKLTKEEIYKKDDSGRYVLSASERQKALVENQIR
jgi:predicted  nucleic acid-binding Zn-ribbon protein